MNDTVEILRCPSCAAPVPLGTGAVAKCLHCGADVPIPDAHVRLREARARDATLRPRAEAILRSIDRPPSLVVKVLARVLDQPMYLFWLFYGVPVGLVSILEGLAASNRIARYYGVTPDDMPAWFAVPLIFGCLLVLVFVPRALGIYANRRVTDRSRLLRALAAQPPEIEGGPSRCRSCGAPLDLTDAIVARCVYCGCESALRIQTKLVAKTEGVVRRLGTTMDDAARENAAHRAATLKMLAKELARYVFHTAVFAGLLMLTTDEDEEGKLRALGVVGVVGSASYLIFLFIWSIAKDKSDDADDRRSGNDVPGWVGIVGPIALWVVGCTAASVFR